MMNVGLIKHSEDYEMSIPNANIKALDKAAAVLGTAMMIAWTFVIGFVGLVLFAAIAYALLFRNYFLVGACSFVIFAPLIMTILWGILRLIAFARERRAASNVLAGPSWRDQRAA
jgi:hypothetical protein